MDVLNEPLPPPLLFVPKNRGLGEQAARALNVLDADGFQRVHVRGEDVPYFTGAVAAAGRRALGITGQDLVEEWLAAGNTLNANIQRRSLAWHDSNAIYGKPALCLIGPVAGRLGDHSRIAICAKYKHLAERYVLELERRGARISRTIVAGALETVCLHGLADFIIDIVVTGKTMARAGLVVHDMISASDLAVLEAG